MDVDLFACVLICQSRRPHQSLIPEHTHAHQCLHYADSREHLVLYMISQANARFFPTSDNNKSQSKNHRLFKSSHMTVTTTLRRHDNLL